MATRSIRPKREDSLLANWSAPLVEKAPSVIRADQPTIPRIVALVSVFLIAVGVFAMISHAFGRRYLLMGPAWGFFWFTVGIGGLLYHAFSDRDVQFRRTYGFLSFGLIVAGLVLLLLKFEDAVGGRFLAYGAPCLALALPFALAGIRHETEEGMRTIMTLVLLAVGVGGLLAGFLISMFWQDFLTGKGIVLIILGLMYVSGFIGMTGTREPLTFLVGMGVGGLGLFSFAVALARSWMSGGGSESYLVPDGLALMGFGLVAGLYALCVCSDWTLIVLLRRELAAYFYSPIAYLVIIGLTLVGWFSFVNFLNILADSRQLEEPVVRYFILSFIPVAFVIFMVSILTMRLFSEEKRSGTLEMLMTAPVNELPIVLSKFFAALIFFLLGMLTWALFLVALRVMGGEPFDYRPLISFFIALACTGAGFVSIGVFVSSITRNQIIAAVITLAILLGFTSVFWLSAIASPPWRDILGYMSYVDLWFSTLNGQFIPRLLVFHLSLAVFFLFLTVKVLDARKWQ